MSATYLSTTQRADPAQHRIVSRRRGVAQRSDVNTALPPLRRALAQVDILKRALASSELQLAAAKRRVEKLTHTNARLRGVAARQAPPDAVRCPAWALTELSLSTGLGMDDLSHLERLLSKRIRVRRGDAVYRFGDWFDALYAIRAGSCKTVLLARDGQDQVAGYHMGGEIIGIDGIGSNIHECEAIALEDMEVYALPFEWIESFARCSDQFRYNLHRLLSQECLRVQTLTLVLGTMRAEKRLAVFLLDLSQRYHARGFSSCEFLLRMTREEIGSYLGLKLETVSRVFSRFQNDGLLQVQGRLVKLLDQVMLRRLAGASD